LCSAQDARGRPHAQDVRSITDALVSPAEIPDDTDLQPRSPAAAPDRREIAVALEHPKGVEDLPRVVASGKGALARQILEIAFARDIKVREDADLAEALAAVDIDSEIPLAAFAAVAEILTYVYRSAASQNEAGQNEGGQNETGQYQAGTGPDHA
jgi:flagellar biosynthesis protein